MAITELPENDKEGANVQVQTQGLPEFPSPSSVTTTFWGVKVSPLEPVTISFRNRPHKSLHISQATLGELCLDNMEDSRSVLSTKIGDNPDLLICSLRLKHREMTPLSLDFGGPGDVVFSVKGPRDIHVIGYWSDHPSATTEFAPPQIFGNEGGFIASKNQLSSSNEDGCCIFGNEGGFIASKNQLSPSSEDGCCSFGNEGGFIASKNQLSSSNEDGCCSFGNEDQFVASKNQLASSNEDGCCSFGNEGGFIASKNELASLNEGGTCKHITEVAPELNTFSHVPQLNIPNLIHLRVQSLSGLVVDIVDGLNKIRMEGGILVQGLSEAQTETLTEGVADKLQGANSVRKKLDYLMVDGVEPRVKHVATHATTQVIGHHQESGASKKEVERSTRHSSPEYHVRRSRKSKRLNKRKKHDDDDDQDDHIRSTNHNSPDYHVLQSRKNRRLNKQKKHSDDDQDEHIRSTNHDSCESPMLDSKKAKKLKKMLKKQKQVEDDDNRSKKHDSCQTPLLGSKEAKKLKKKLNKHDDNREPKKARKQKKKIVQEEVRAVNKGSLQTFASDSREVEKSKKDVVEEARSQEVGRVLIVCALPCHVKR